MMNLAAPGQTPRSDRPPDTSTEVEMERDDGPGRADVGLFRLADRSSIRAAGVRLAQQARREILIFSRDLDSDLYDQIPFLDAVRQLALETPRLPVRVLVFEPLLPVVAGHRLIELSRRLSSRISIRRVADAFRDRVDAFLIVDARGYCLRHLADRPEAVVAFHAPREARRLRAVFEQIWQLSDGDSDLRRLDL